MNSTRLAPGWYDVFDSRTLLARHVQVILCRSAWDPRRIADYVVDTRLGQTYARVLLPERYVWRRVA